MQIRTYGGCAHQMDSVPLWHHQTRRMIIRPYDGRDESRPYNVYEMWNCVNSKIFSYLCVILIFYERKYGKTE